MKCGAKENDTEYKKWYPNMHDRGEDKQVNCEVKREIPTTEKMNERTMGTGEWDNQ